jgi:hypothetical protein
MPANTTPIFPLTPNIFSSAALTAANTNVDGTTGVYTNVFTAGANGSRLDYIKSRALGTNVATVMRVFVNHALFTEITIALTALSQVAALADVVIPLDLGLPANAVVDVTIGTTVAAGFIVTGVGGDY